MIRKITQIEQEENYKKPKSFLGNKILTVLILGLALLGPILFIPGGTLSVVMGKSFLFAIVFFIGLALYGIFLLQSSSITIPKHWLLISFLLIVIIGGIGTIFTASPSMSLFGYGFETTTLLFLILMGGMIFFSSQAMRSYENLTILFFGLLGASGVLMVIHLLRFIIGADFLNLGVLAGGTATLIGSWGDLSIFFGITVILAALTLETAPFQGWFKTASAIIGAVALVMLLFMNNQRVLLVLGFVLLVSTLYLFSLAYWNRSEGMYKRRKIPWYTMGAFIVILGGIFLGGTLNQLASRHQSIVWNDILPPASLMLQATSTSIGHNLLTGYGLNTFSYVWNQVKPVELSGTNIGNVDFKIGSGYVPTQLATQGIFGVAVWIIFFVLLLMLIIRVMKRGFSNDVERYFIVTLMILVIYLSIISWVYIPGNYILILFGILIGSFLGILMVQDFIKEKIISLNKTPRTNVLMIVSSIGIILVAFVGGYFMIKNVVSLIDYANGVSLLGTADQEKGIQKIINASELIHHDIYHAKLAEIAISQMFSLIQSQATAKNPADKATVSKQVEQLVGLALGNINVAIKNNQLNYRNYIILGDIYKSMMLLGANDVYDLAVNTYKKVEGLNPRDSTAKLLSAQLALAKQDTAQAQTLIQQSIDQYPTRDAYILLAQIQSSQKKWSDVATSLEKAISFDRTNAALYLNLAAVYEKAGEKDKANQLYEMIRKQFTDGDAAIQKIRKDLGL